MIQRKEDKFRSGIYVIQNNANSKKYVGKSKNIYKRIMQHITQLNTKNKNENRHLINAWHKYGRSCFTYYVIEYIDEENTDVLERKLAERELYWIKTLKTTKRKFGYNMRIDSKGKCIVTDSTRQKCSKSQTERYKNPEERQKTSNASKQNHKIYPESYEKAKRKLALSRRTYRIAKCDKNTNEILKIYDVIQDVIDENPGYYKQAIKGCCSGTKMSYKSFNWHYCDLASNSLIIK